MEKKKKVPMPRAIAWSTRAVSLSIATVLVGYITYFATDFMGISALTAGMIFMVSKIFDGVTDIIAGYIIDRTNTKLGKGRPYELALIGYWGCTVLIFCAPKMGITPSCIYLFVMYSLVNSVFYTLLACAEPVYLSNAMDSSDQSVTYMSVTGLISMVFSMIGAIAIPQMVVHMGTTREGWMKLSLILAVPCTLIGLIRFATVKEKNVDRAVVDKISIKEMVHVIKNNKYILIFSIIILIANIGTNLVNSTNTYYYRYVMKDLGIASIMSMASLVMIVIMVAMPKLSAKYGFVNVIRVTTLAGAVGYLIRLLDVESIPVVFLSNVFASFGFFTLYSFAASFIVDCIDYGEWKFGRRSEGTTSCIQSVTAKIGTAIGVGAVGVLMGASGYDGGLKVQSTGANAMIVVLAAVVPAILCLFQFLLLRKYDLDKILPQIRKELAAKKGESNE